jgi:glucose/arabinose dehydrogenase
MPEYGGDGKKTGAENAIDPIVAFPAHLAPNGLLFYTGNKFPEKYKNGAFVAFHAKSAELQKGYFVAFVPFKNGKPSGKWEIFAENFAAGTDVHKPCGLAMANDGSIYVTDDAKGNIYRIQYDQ